MAPKEMWNIAKKRMVEDGGAVPKEDGNLLREFEAKHEEHFLNSWLRDSTEDKVEDM